MKLNLKSQMGLLFFLLAAIVFIQTAMVYRQFRRIEPFGPLVSVAGQQEFLSQRIELLLERLPRGSEEDRRLLRDTMAQIDRAIRVFDQGGEIKGYRVPPVPESMRGALARQKEVWSELTAVIRQLLLLTPEQIKSSEAIETGRALAQDLLDSSVQLLDAFETWRTNLSRDLRDATLGMGLLAVLVIVAAFVSGWAKIDSPIKEVKSELSRIFPEGELAPIRTNEVEMESVAELVTEVKADVDRLRTERREIEEELRQVEADYRGIFLNVVVGILQMDRAGRIVAANPALARILGYDSLSDFLATVTNGHEQIFAAPHHRRQLESLGQAGSGIFELESEVHRKDGSVIWVLESGSLVRADGETSYYESVLIDITPRKKAQESLRELSRLLLRSQEEERRRIGRDLHDSTGQLLAALQMSLDRLAKSSERLSSKDREILATCTKLSEQCSREVRSVSHLLHPPLLEELGLEYALREYTEGFEERSSIRVSLNISPELERLSPDAETALFRIVQEALTNVHRHAESPSADIRLEAVSKEIRLEVEDQGRGLPPEILAGGQSTVARTGVGMKGMEERLHQLGGRLTVESGDWGTRIRAELPYSQNTHPTE